NKDENNRRGKNRQEKGCSSGERRGMGNSNSPPSLSLVRSFDSRFVETYLQHKSQCPPDRGPAACRARRPAVQPSAWEEHSGEIPAVRVPTRVCTKVRGEVRLLPSAGWD